MFETVNYGKEKRKKRLIQKNRKKIYGDDKYEKNKRHSKYSSYEDQYLDAWELINSR
jgi:hypothetical protein